MKLWEVMRLLEEDPSRKFEYQDVQKKWLLYADAGCYDDRVFYMLDCWDNKGELKTGYRVGSLHGNLSTLDNWQLVKQPVTWQEAIQAWAEGKTITCKTERFTEKFALTNYDVSFDISLDKITDGTWYVED